MEKLVSESSNQLISEACIVGWRNFGRKIVFYVPSFSAYKSNYYQVPSFSFPSISVTGRSCALNCKHCGGRLLRTMIPVRTPNDLLSLCVEIKRKGAIGCLISGGCLPDGSVPLSKFIDVIAKVKQELGLTVVVHSGLIDFETASRLKDAGVDAVSVDIIGSDDTISSIYNLNVSSKRYEETLEALSRSGVPFTPHVLVGLHLGSIKGEFEALKMIAKHKPSALIIIVFFPIKGTLMENVRPPPPEEVVNILSHARVIMPNVPIALGCARPKGAHRIRTDVLAVEAGVNAIAYPSPEAVEKARDLGLEVKFSPTCCSQVFKEFQYC
ncbi:MAG: radical SAM protein [Nitrososphaerota archaeon]|nr:radical SAM protein [Candidatus Bathyarchaeota archaeon]MDW8049089.1 radical SAM protein [Nitrososphaerota archaeon]